MSDGPRPFPKLTVKNCLEFRYVLLGMLTSIPLGDTPIFRRTQWVADGECYVDELTAPRDTRQALDLLVEKFKQADVVLWKPGLIELSAEGSECFENRPLPEMHNGLQLWLLSEGELFAAPYTGSDEITAEMSSPFVLVEVNKYEIRCVYVLQDGKSPRQFIRGFSVQREGDFSVVYYPSARVVASWLFLKTKIAKTAEYQPPASVQKHWSRRNIEIPRVKIVELRSFEVSEASKQPDRSVEHSHRWLVRPHWRNQFMPRMAVHEPRFISAYVKGPEGKPLVHKDTVFRAVR